MSDNLFQQFTHSQRVCFLRDPFLRLTAMLKLATCCSPTVFNCGSLPTKPVTCRLMLVPMLLTPLRYALFCPSTRCRFLTNAEQVHSGSIHPKGATHFW